MANALDFVAHLSPTDWQALRACGQPLPVKRGEVLFAAGGTGNHVYIVERGRVKIFQLSAKGKETLLWFCALGEIFGVSELCTGSARQVYAQASEDTLLIGIERDRFKDFLASRPAMSLRVIDILAQRLRHLSHTVERLATTDVRERLQRLLVQLGERYGRRKDNGVCIDIGITHQEMADMIGTTRQSVTSILSELKRDGAVAFYGKRLYLAPTFNISLAAAPAAPLTSSLAL